MDIYVGKKVICNGYEGSIREICQGQLANMVVVRLYSGEVCVPTTELRELGTVPFWTETLNVS